ncbi:MAG: DNA-3-methyladenine glycosylase [Verrucomicrobia bacterium 61-8]|nr:DNA-3-methyladenine glycosylase 2 family protein [Verrucomicrobiota bacterium]OJU99625.1 MAG: DNA-3-methyladenine glycosylase [Verrucomicrobia bacterium 61-8]
MLVIDFLAAEKHLAKADPVMRGLIRQHGRLSIRAEELRQAPFESLARAIANQQLSGRVADVILGRFVKLFPGKKFPTARDLAAVTDEEIRSVGFSWAKIAALRDLAAKVIDGTVPTTAKIHKLSDEEIIERLTAVRGVGQWTVEMLLIFKLGRPDVLPVDDLGVRQGFTRAYGLAEPVKPRALREYGERWRPYRTVVTLYLWQVMRAGGQGGAPAI